MDQKKDMQCCLYSVQQKKNYSYVTNTGFAEDMSQVSLPFAPEMIVKSGFYCDGYSHTFYAKKMQW